jgi:hypothetical protein
MPAEPNPYQTPETPQPRESDLPESFSDRDKFILLGGVMLAGLLTVFPWPAVLFIALSMPLFVHAWRLERLLVGCLRGLVGGAIAVNWLMMWRRRLQTEIQARRRPKG